MINGLSFDIEEWWHILDTQIGTPVETWDTLQSRVCENTARLLGMLQRHRVRATFFVLGCIAERHPDLICQIAEQGHTVGSHGHHHLPVNQLTPDSFAQDLDRSIAAIHRACGVDVISFRAPGFSITESEYWAFEILAERGITLDSSLFLGSHRHGGISLRRNRPFRIDLPSGRTITELPICGYPVGGCSFPFVGGGYLRALPKMFLRPLLASMHMKNNLVVMYAHPRDFDPCEPRMPLPPFRKLRHYVGTRSIPEKLRVAMETLHFSTLEDAAANAVCDMPLVVENAPSIRTAVSCTGT